MRLSAIALFVCALVSGNGCSSQSTNQTSTAPSASPALSVSPNLAKSATPGAISSVVKPKVDACTLLTSDEIKAVQGEAVKDPTPSSRGSGDFIVSQCYYGLPTPSNSISLTLTERNPDSKGGEGVKDYWERTFGKDEKKSGSERKQERDEEKKKPEAKRESEEEESAPLEPVSGLGDEAFWSASRVGGALYVLKRDHFFIISVGGKGDAEAKLKKSKTLAQKALRRL
jgi:hypothetical protein